jgi:hypothetical protein
VEILKVSDWELKNQLRDAIGTTDKKSDIITPRGNYLAYSVKADVRKISKEQASYFLSHCHYKYQRNTQKKQVAFLSDQMIRGRFHPTAPIIFADCKSSNNLYLLNGYHTLNAIVNTDCIYDMVIVTFNVSSDKEASAIYTHIDIGRNRSGKDRLKATEIADEVGVSGHHIGRSVSALKYMAAGFPADFAKGKIAIEDELNLIREWKEEVYFFFEFFNNSQGPKHIKSRVLIVPVLCLSFIIFRYDIDNAIEFLSRVIDGIGLSGSDPRLKLRDRLIETTRTVDNRKKVSNGYIANSFARCWNSYIKGEELQFFRITPAQMQRNLILENTPLDGSIKTFDFMKVKII